MRPSLSSGIPARSFKDFDFVGSSPVSWSRIAGQNDTAAVASAAPVNGTLYAVPFISPARGGSVDTITVAVTVVGALSNVARLGIWEATSDVNPYPGILLGSSPSIDTTTPAATSLRTYTPTTPITLRPHWMYWLGFVCSTGTAPTLRGLTVNGCWPLGVTDVTVSTPIFGLSIVGQSAASAMPNPFPASAIPMIAVPIPAMGYHFSA